MSPWMIEVIGMAAAIIGTLGWMPQAIKTIKTRDTSGLSLGTNLMLLTTVILWFIYGVAIGSWPLMLGNIVTVILVGIIVVLKIRHG